MSAARRRPPLRPAPAPAESGTRRARLRGAMREVLHPGRPRYLGAHEHILLETRQHPFAILGALIDALMLILPAGLVIWGVNGIVALRGAPAHWITRVLLVFMLWIAARLVMRVVQWEFERVLVTNQKVIHVHGVIARRIASTPLSKVSEFTVNQSLLGRLFGYGSFVVDVPGGREQALHGLSYLPDPADLYRVVTDRARSEEAAMGSGAAGTTTVLRPWD